MKQIAILICAPITLFVSMLIALTLLHSMPPILRWLITVLIASALGIGSYFFCLRKMQSIAFPYWDRLAQQLDKTVEFRLSNIGHVIYVGMIGGVGYAMYLAATIFQHAAPHNFAYLFLALLFILMAMLVRNFLSRAWWSPLYEGPFLVASPAGIQSNSCLIPWSDVESTSTGGGSYYVNILVNTKKGCSEYDRSVERSAYEPHQVTFYCARGALPESIAHYLEVRAKFQNMNSVAGASLEITQPA